MRFRVVPWPLPLALLVGLVLLTSGSSSGQGLRAQITTDRGCGDNAVYRVGDLLVVTFRIDGAQQAQATIVGVFPGGQVVQLFSGTVAGGQYITKSIAVIGGAPGKRSVQLTASIQGGEVTAKAECSFVVASAPQLSAQIQTDRGCGATAIYHEGDPVHLFYRIDGAAQVDAEIDEILPTGQTRVLFHQVVAGNQALQFLGQATAPAGSHGLRLIATVPGGTLTAQAPCSFVVASAPVAQLSAQIQTDRGCGANALYQEGDPLRLSYRIDGAAQVDALIEEIPPVGQTHVLFHQVVAGNQALQFTGQATAPAGSHGLRLTATVPGTTLTAQAPCSFVVQAVQTPAGPVQRLLAVGDPVAATGRLGMFGVDPVQQDRNVSAIRRTLDDGTVFVADYAGASLLRFAPGGGQIASAARVNQSTQPAARQITAAKPTLLLDTSSRDPIDGVGLARLLRVETSRNGVHAVLALRADNTRAIYRLDNGTLTRLSLLPGATGPVEMAIGDTGQIAYVAPPAGSPVGAGGPVGLFQASSPVGVAAGQVVGLLQQGQNVLNNGTIDQMTDLTSNGAGDLSVRITLRQASGGSAQGVVLKNSRGLFLIAVTGERVARDRSGNGAGLLAEMRRPAIGPDGTVVFLGTGDGFANFYVIGPNRALQPLLVGTGWNTAEGTYDYQVAADGAVAVRTSPGGATGSALFLITPNGNILPVANPGDRIQPTGQPVFGPNGNENLFYFLAKNLDGPVDRNGQIPVVLCRSRLVQGQPSVDAVAAPGQPVPGLRGVQLLTITQRPVVSANAVTFGALIGGTDHFPVPTGRLFQVPLGGQLTDATLLAQEGDDLPGANRIGILRTLSYTNGGSLIFSGLLPGSGSLVATLGSQNPTIASKKQPAASLKPAKLAAVGDPVARIASVASVAPLLAIGQSLDRPDRVLLAILGRLVALGSNRQLVAARFSQTGVGVGEGLFSLTQDGQVQALAVSGDPAPGLAGAKFTAFGDSNTYTLSPPAVSTDGNVVFKARLDVGGTATFGVFEWNGTGITPVGLTNPNPDNLALSADDLPPYTLDRWSAGPGGSAYLMEQHTTRSATQVTRIFERSSTVLAPLIVPGVTPVNGGSLGALAGLFDYVLDGTGSVFVSGTVAGAHAVLASRPTGLAPVVMQGQPVPPSLDGTDVRGLVIGSSFSLMPDSERGALLFRATVMPQGTAESPTSPHGLFRLGPQGLDTMMVEGLAVGGSRNLTYGTLATSPDRQTLNGTSAFATLLSGKWTIYRWRAGQTTVIAQEGQLLPGAGGARAVSLDPGPLLDLPPGSGPVFTLNDAGQVAFMASDGVRWGIYLFKDSGP